MGGERNEEMWIVKYGRPDAEPYLIDGGEPMSMSVWSPRQKMAQRFATKLEAILHLSRAGFEFRGGRPTMVRVLRLRARGRK